VLPLTSAKSTASSVGAVIGGGGASRGAAVVYGRAARASFPETGATGDFSH